MKKIIIATAVILVAAVAAQAQVPNAEVAIADAGFKGLLPNSKLSTKKVTSSDSLQNAIKRQVAKEQAKAEKNKKIQGTAPKETAQATASVSNKPSQKAIEKDDSKVIGWIKALILGGPMPGESEKSYRLRLDAQRFAAAQPYK